MKNHCKLEQRNSNEKKRRGRKKKEKFENRKKIEESIEFQGGRFGVTTFDWRDLSPTKDHREK